MAIPGYSKLSTIVHLAVDPPGNAENVTLAVSPANPPSPFAVDLHIRWQPPSDLGSMGKIDKYVIRTGKAEQLIPPLPASFTEKPMVRNVSEVIFILCFSSDFNCTSENYVRVMYTPLNPTFI